MLAIRSDPKCVGTIAKHLKDNPRCDSMTRLKRSHEAYVTLCKDMTKMLPVTDKDFKDYATQSVADIMEGLVELICKHVEQAIHEKVAKPVGQLWVAADAL